MLGPSRLVPRWPTTARESDGTARFGTSPAWLAAVFALFLILAVCVQLKTGALDRDSEAAHYPDEPAHVVTSLLVHDYVAAFLPERPLRFAETYYLHYPKVAVGMWPPVFHIFAGLWMLIFGASKNALLLFVAFEGALLATALFGLARSLIHPVAAAGLGVLLLLNPLAQYCISLVMLDTQVALLDLLTVFSLTRFFGTRQTRDGAVFGALTVVAMLTKGNACALVLMPPILILIRRDWRVLRSAGLYVAVGIILMLGVPWQLLSWNLLTASVPIARFGAAYMFSNLNVYSHHLLANVGWPVLLVSAVGFVISLKRAAGCSENSRGVLAMAGACTLFLAVMLFQCIAPVPVDQRYMLPVIAPILFFFAVVLIKQLI
jgi:4-amino-4-deoxy-L-arabinose transferase-like glycosyltransferase